MQRTQCVDTAESQALVQTGLARTNFVWKTWTATNTLVDPLCPDPVYKILFLFHTVLLYQPIALPC